MAIANISLAEFNYIASGEYNAGQIDIQTNRHGEAELVKVNNHVWKTGKNRTELSPERVLEVKETFLAALQRGGVNADAMKAIRNQLGIPEELNLPADKAQRDDILAKRFTPLTRADVRTILDTYANEGKGHNPQTAQQLSFANWQAGQATAHMSAGNAARRDAVNAALNAAQGARGNAAVDFGVTDALSVLSLSRSLADLDARRSERCTGENAVNDRQSLHTSLVNSFQDLASAALKMLPANVRESDEFQISGETVKLVKGEDGRLSAIVGKGALASKVDLKMDATNFVMYFIGRTIADAETLGPIAAKNILGRFYDRDLEGGLVASEKTSLTRQFAALALARKSGDRVNFDALVQGNYNTGILVEMAERALGGEAVGDTLAALDAYHAKLVSDNAGLPDDVKAMLERVANLPLEKNLAGELLVHAPIVGDIDQVVAALPPPAAAPAPRSLDDIGGLDGVKDFIADIVFSDDTMVGDVTINRPGEAMRKMLSSDRNVVALAEIVKNAGLVDRVCAPQIAGVVKDGLGKMIAVLDEAFKAANNGKSLADAARENGFAAQLAAFLKSAEKLPGAELAKFDNIILSMANKGCESIQTFINGVFKVESKSVNAQGGIVNDPYKNMTPEQIKAELQGKTLNQILDSASNSDAPGQVGFFRQVISTYFTSLGKADKRSCFAAAMRYAQTFDFAGLDENARPSAQKAAVNKFTGAILKGTSPLLQKMMQGLPKDIMGGYADALNDMKSALAPIPRKIVQAHLMKMIDESDGRIKSITLEKSLGAASVGEAFLCKFKYVNDEGSEKEDEFVVKIMRHDAEKRVKAEAEIFTAAASKIPGMDKTWEGQLKQYMTEFDFTNEAKNVEEGVKLYNIADDPDHPLRAIAPNVHSMKLSKLVPAQKNVMVAEVAGGRTVDKYFKESIDGVRNAAKAVFKQDPTTGRIQWVDGPVDPKTGKPKPVPVFKENIPATAMTNLQLWLASNYNGLEDTSKKILQATKAWFHEAILGSGKFHGDAHSGNFMVSGPSITFIDFGNLYTLKDHREDGVNEKTELLRVITGAAFRDKNQVLKGFEKLMSDAGRAALAANRAKAEAILEAVLDKSKGTFSFNIVYRLQAAVVELQKLGLELPPQINCFIQSLVRLSNVVSEMNTICNQCKAMLNAMNTVTLPPPQRDELDLVGKAFDVYTSAEGRAIEKDKFGKDVPAYLRLLNAEEFGGRNKNMSEMFKEDGSYTRRVADRVGKAQNPVATASGLVATLVRHLDQEHGDILAKSYVENLEAALKKLEDDYAKAGTAEAKDAAVKAFACDYAITVRDTVQSMSIYLLQASSLKINEPSTFASAVTDVLFDSFDALTDGLDDGDKKALLSDAHSVATGELNLNFMSALWPPNVVEAIVNDAKNLGGDGDYQIEIGV